MIDAATIGITLALNNGVSDGIAQIRRELAALDMAVTASSAGLTVLAAQGAGLAAPARAAAALLPALPKPAAVPMRDEEEAPSATEPVATAAAMPAMPTVSRPVLSVALAANVPVAAPLPDFAGFGRALAARVDEEGPKTSPPVTPADAQAVVLPVPGMAPIPPAPVARMRETEQDTAGLRAAVAPAVPMVAAPAAPIPSVPLASNSPNSQGALPVAGEPAAQEGAIYMDGDLIGRFIADHLAEVAMRAPAGATAFDPRLSPNWSGVAGAA